MHVHFANDPFADPQGMRPGSGLEDRYRGLVARHIRRSFTDDVHPRVPELKADGHLFAFTFLRGTVTHTRISRAFRVAYWKV